MKDRLRSAHHEDTRVPAKAPVDVAERRSAPRQHFIAEAQIIEISSGAKLSARSCDLVVDGCYVDSLNTFPVGTLVRIRLKREETIVEANGNVVYRMPGLGMGIAFRDVTPETREALEQWLSHMPAERDSFAPSLPRLEFDRIAVSQQPAGQFFDLVELLVKKGILTSAEAASLLKESIET